MVTVAMHRLPPAVKIPAELLTFRREEWMAPMMGCLGGPRFGIGRLPGMPGSKPIRTRSSATCSVVIRGEVRMKRGLWEWVP
jgi:hypothetical protein